MTRDDIIRMAREAGLLGGDEARVSEHEERVGRFAALIEAAKDAEHEEKMRWDIHSCGPACNRYVCIVERKARIEEREKCQAKLDALTVAIADAGFSWTPEMRKAYNQFFLLLNTW